MNLTTDQILSWCHNDTVICEAILEVAREAETGNVDATLKMVARSQQLILQSLKSNTALRVEIRENLSNQT